MRSWAIPLVLSLCHCVLHRFLRRGRPRDILHEPGIRRFRGADRSLWRAAWPGSRPRCCWRWFALGQGLAQARGSGSRVGHHRGRCVVRAGFRQHNGRHARARLGSVWALHETVFFALAMDIADGRIAASMFAIMMGISNLGSAVADGAATALSDDLGFRAVFWILAAVNLLTFPVLRRLFRAAPSIGEQR